MVTNDATGRRVPLFVAKKRLELDPEARYERRSIRSIEEFLVRCWGYERL